MDILLIDDEPIIHQALTPFLRRSGHQVLDASDGREGLALAGEKKPDLIISDIRMPGMNGLDLLERLKVRTPTTPVVLITGHGDISTAVAALDSGAFAYLHKPVKLEELVSIIARIEERQLLENAFLQQQSRRIFPPQKAATHPPTTTIRDIDDANAIIRDKLQALEDLWQQTENALEHCSQEGAIATLVEAMPKIMRCMQLSSERIRQSVHQYQSVQQDSATEA